MNLQGIIFLPILLGSFGYATYKFRQLLLVMKAHRGPTRKSPGLIYGIWALIYHVLFQRSLWEDPRAGLIHSIIFWGFIIITVGTMEQFFTTLMGGADFSFIGEAPYRVLLFFHDFFTFAIIPAVLYALYRRKIQKIPRLGKSRDAEIILYFTGALMVSIIMMNVFLIASEDSEFNTSMVFSFWLSEILFSGGSLDFVLVNDWGVIFRWVHMLIVLAFAVYIPSSKHLHIIAAAPNVFFKPRSVVSPMIPINFEDEKLDQYGAGKNHGPLLEGHSGRLLMHRMWEMRGGLPDLEHQ